ncbi:hypothetical protein EGT74_22400 [Chitinophaga lutea]|uniref:DUF6915 domain-containing protein n=1 Tax=Chitinophaga lutea TaxID=2488634 RepID=A0A3N4PNH9_9BACT|nr:hypothetical protein [Chitinophaga lutea]RPE09726.1 hypothetical protein EGT74_22400 [Chitinophaga lutea]
MNYWKHSLLSKKKFDGHAEDYLHIHKFLDMSKLFYFHNKHRILLHHTYGIDLCVQKFGETLVNADNRTILIRDVAAEHCKEDLMGMVPTLNHWFKYVDDALPGSIKPLNPTDRVLKEFVLRPLLMSGLKSSLIITHSNFGIFLAKEILGLDYALELSNYLPQINVNEMLQYIKLSERWQYTPDLKQLKDIENGIDQ